MERKSQYRVLDFDDLLLYWHAMMSEDRIAKSVAAHFDHVLVDEYQDTNKLQNDILHALKPDGQGVTVVGDDAQAIYSFRAAAVENILGFPDRYRPKAETVTLAQNFRSSQSVLDAANALMADAPRQYRKHLLSMRGQGPRPKLVTVDDLPTQAEFICTRVLASREAGIPLRRQAVLFRTGTHSDVLEIELAKRKIPFVKYGGLKFLEAAHVKDLLAVLRWADNPRNQLAAFRVLQFMQGMGPANAKRALDHFIASRLRSGHRFEKFEPPNDARLHWKKFYELFTALAEPNREWRGQIALVRELYKPHMERMYEHVHTRIGDLDQLELLSSQYQTRERFVTELTLDPPNATGDLSGQPHARRGLPGPFDHPLGQGHGVGQRVHPQRGRRQLPERVLDRQGRGHRRRTPSAVRRDDPRAQRTQLRRAAAFPDHQPAQDFRRPRVRRPQPLPHREGDQVLRRADLPGRERRSEDGRVGCRFRHHRRGVAPQADVVRGPEWGQVPNFSHKRKDLKQLVPFRAGERPAGCSAFPELQGESVALADRLYFARSRLPCRSSGGSAHTPCS